MVIKPQYANANSFNPDVKLASVLVGNKWGYIDPTGKIVIAPSYISTNAFKEGLVAVEVKE